jgi:hypothetical protein
MSASGVLHTAAPCFARYLVPSFAHWRCMMNALYAVLTAVCVHSQHIMIDLGTGNNNKVHGCNAARNSSL